ncbi:hypothetical protein AB1Y20_015617 [Prymnesium parvum]|uniref:Uncharacterized protein n=1 Tax=Prymnesium parvum TaxID=97485 RepID=A0AB34JYA0_PRYPA|mmetsp:Transcript_25164/g.60848  ORF Transcript_25164/g.60848 Transcript_25164/m.60848 type:complete len:181 (-) Transcript_25164:254-796(-)
MTPSVPLAGYTPSTLLGAPKGERLHLRLRAHGRSLTLVKVRGESVQHVLMKGFLWAMLLPQHPDLLCEVNANHHYKPDVVSFSERGVPLCWGECGAVTTEKLSQLASEFPSTHFVVSKWAHSDIRGYAQQLRLELALPPRAAPFEVVSIPDNCSDEHITRDGEVTLSREDLQIEQIAELI